MMIQRKLRNIATPRLERGFLGEGHLAARVVGGGNFEDTDPFIVLMDDQLDLPGGAPVGGPHPHAGFETVTLVLEGDGQHWETGSFELMTAGKGIVHTEEITAKTRMRILQLWLTLPPEKRWTEPFFQSIKAESVPAKQMEKAEIKVYSGASNGLTSPVINQTPLTVVDVVLGPEGRFTQEVPATYTGFIYVIEGAVWGGGERVVKGQVAWLDAPRQAGMTELVLIAGAAGARLVYYAGEPQRAPIVSYGPFIADTRADIPRLYHEYNRGRMGHVNDLPETQIVHYG